MPAEVIACPACANPVRVPETLLGQAVRCPKCKAYFTAPTRDASGFLGMPELLENPPTHIAQAADGKRPLDKSPMFVPGILMLCVGVIGSIANGFVAFQANSSREAAQRLVNMQVEQYTKFTKKQIPEDQVNQLVETVPIVLGVAFLISLVPLITSIAILKMRFWSFAVAGSFLSFLNIGNCCCLIGVPVSIYCLIKLFDPDVRAMFY